MDKTITELLALLTKLECFCYDNNLPFFVTVRTNTEKNNGYITKISSPAVLGRPDDKIADLSLIMNGFVAIPESKPMEMHMD